jgi:hypothetical protein
MGSFRELDQPEWRVVEIMSGIGISLDCRSKRSKTDQSGVNFGTFTGGR